MKALSHSDRSLSWRCVLLTAGVAAALLVPAMAQNAQSDSAKPAKAEKVKAETAKAAPGQTGGHWGPGDQMPDKYEFGIFGGGSFFETEHSGLVTRQHAGGAFGAKVTENFWKYFGLQESYTFRENNVTFDLPNQPVYPSYGFGQRLMDYGVNPLLVLHAPRLEMAALRDGRHRGFQLPSDRCRDQAPRIRPASPISAHIL